MRASRKGSANDRFQARFTVNAESGCWDWTGPKNKKGYGYISGEVNGKRHVPAGRHMLAHRVSWLIHRGDIPESDSAHGTVVMHKCDNPACVNPDHLVLGSQSDNVKDMIVKGRKVSGTPTGVNHWNASITDPEAIELIRSTVRNTKALAERFGVHICTIKRIRQGRSYGG
jgi:hypothetical protein